MFILLSFRSGITDKEEDMSRYIKDFIQGMIMTFYRMAGLMAIPTGAYILCILHTSSYVWLGIVGFLVALFLIAIGVLITRLFGWYDRTLSEDYNNLKELLEEKKYE